MLVNKWDIHRFDEVESTNLIVKERIRTCNGDGPARTEGTVLNVQRGRSLNIGDDPYRHEGTILEQRGRSLSKGDGPECAEGTVLNVQRGRSSQRFSMCSGDGPSGFVAVAKSQTGGKGMRGHSWCSPEGGLYFSLLLEPSLPPKLLPEIPLRIATVVMNALQPFSTEPLTIKPPNDIILQSSTAEHPSRIIRAARSQNSLQDTLPSQLLSFPTYSVNKSSEGSNSEGLLTANRSATRGTRKVDVCNNFLNQLVSDLSEGNQASDMADVNRSTMSGVCKVNVCNNSPNHLVSDLSEGSQCDGLTAVNRSTTSGVCKINVCNNFSNHLVSDLSEGNQVPGMADVNRSATSGNLKVKKLVGISTELYMNRLCVGIGINIFHPEKPIKVEGENIPVYLEDFSNCNLSIDFALKTVLSALNAKLEI